MARSKAFHDGAIKALEDGDRALADQYYRKQREELVRSQMRVSAAGLPPGTLAPNAQYTSPNLLVERSLYLQAAKRKEFSQALLDNQFTASEDFLRGVMEQYRERNESRYAVDTSGYDANQMRVHRGTMEPLVMDPMEVADHRQRMVKLDQAMKAIDPSWSVFTHQRTKNVATWLARESSMTTSGFIESGEFQDVPEGIVHATEMAVLEGAESGMNFLLGIAYGGMDLVGLPVPTNYIEGPDGKILTNAGKAPGIVEIGIALKSRLMGQNVVRQLAKYGELREHEQARLGDMENLFRGVASVMGTVRAFGAVAGPAMEKGQKAFIALSQKGLMSMARTTSSTVVKATEFLIKGSGAAVGNALVEGLAFGRSEGYAKAAMHGAMMGPVLMGFGWMGRRADKYLSKWESMPLRMRNAISGAMVDGGGFSTLEAAQTGALWEFMRDPKQSTWNMYVQNMLAFGILKGATGRAPFDTPEMMEAIAQSRNRRRGETARKVSEVEAELGPKEAGTKLPETVEEIRRMQEEGPTPENLERFREKTEEASEKLHEGIREMPERMTEELKAEQGPAPVTEKKGLGEPPYEVVGPLPGSLEIRQQKLRETAERMGVPYESLRELGDQMRIRDNPEATLGERTQAAERIEELEKDLDIMEAMQDPVFNAEMREDLSEEAMRELNVEGEGVDPRTVDPDLGERAGPGSMRAGANPYRQQEKLTPEGDPGTMISKIFQILEGKQGRLGVRIPFTDKRIGAKKGSEVQAAFRSGHMEGRALGVLKVLEHLIRTKEGKDLVVAVHEFSHEMQRKLMDVEGGEFWKRVEAWVKRLPAEAKAEIMPFLEGYGGVASLTWKQRGAEAWADWFARDALRDPILRRDFPALSREFDAWINAPAQRAFRDGQWRDLKKEISTWIDMGSGERVSGTIRRPANQKGLKNLPYDFHPIESSVDRMVKAFFDTHIKLKKSQERWLKYSDVDPTELSILQDPSRMMDSTAMSATKEAESFLINGPHDLAYRRITGAESFFGMLGKVAKGYKGAAREKRIKDFMDLLHSERVMSEIGRAEERGGIFKTPVPKSDYVVKIRELLEANPEFAGMAKRMRATGDALVDIMVEAGGLSAEDAQRMKDIDVTYIPLVRAIDGTIAKMEGGRGVAEKGTGIKPIKGGSRDEFMDPIEAMMDVTRSMLLKARKLMVMKATYRLSLETGTGGLATRIPRAKVPKRFRIDETFDALKKAVMESSEGESAAEWEEAFGIFGALLKHGEVSPAMVTLWGQKDLPFGEKDPIIAYTPMLTEAELMMVPKSRRKQAREDNGKMIWLQLDPPFFESLMGIDQPISAIPMNSGVWKFLTIPAKIKHALAVGLSPAFSAANLMRDTLSTPVFSRDGTFEPLGGLRRVILGGAIQLRYGGHKWWQGAMEKAFGEGDQALRELYQMYQATGVATSSRYNQGEQRKVVGEGRGLVHQSKKAIELWSDFWGTPESWIRIGEMARVVERARGEGKSDLEAAYEGAEGAREITVNFARAGDIARAYNKMTPFFSATLAGQRRMFRALTGAEGKTDAQRAEFQRRAFANGFVSITLPALAAWLMVHDEDWYKDLPTWRKLHFVNFMIPGTTSIFSAPFPHEVGSLFGSIPIAFLEKATDDNPIEIMPALWEAMFPYLENTSSFIPAAIQGIGEIYTNKDFFRDRPITPLRLQSRPRQEQVTKSTSVAAQKMFTLPMMDWFFQNPIELEHLLSSYTAGATTTLFRAVDEILSLKDHPGLTPANIPIAPFVNRFFRQTPHSASRTVDDVYTESKRIEGLRLEDRTLRDRALLQSLNRAKQEISRIRRDLDSKRIDKVTADRRQFEAANRALRKVK